MISVDLALRTAVLFPLSLVAGRITRTIAQRRGPGKTSGTAASVTAQYVVQLGREGWSCPACKFGGPRVSIRELRFHFRTVHRNLLPCGLSFEIPVDTGAASRARPWGSGPAKSVGSRAPVRAPGPAGKSSAVRPTNGVRCPEPISRAVGPRRCEECLVPYTNAAAHTRMPELDSPLGGRAWWCTESSGPVVDRSPWLGASPRPDRCRPGGRP